MAQESVPVAKHRKKVSKTLIVGVLVLAYGVLSIFGNYVQWAGAVKAKAQILTAKEQWVRRGSDYLKLQVRYDVDGKPVTGEVYAFPSELDENSADGGIDVIYKKQRPTYVVSEATLQDKRKLIPWVISVGVLLVGIGLFRQFGMKSRNNNQERT